MTEVIDRLLHERTAARSHQRHGLYSRWRPATLRAVGVMLHPTTVTDAWYAADCPSVLDAKRAGVPLGDRVRWRLACTLRGAARSSRNGPSPADDRKGRS